MCWGRLLCHMCGGSGSTQGSDCRTYPLHVIFCFVKGKLEIRAGLSTDEVAITTNEHAACSRTTHPIPEMLRAVRLILKPHRHGAQEEIMGWCGTRAGRSPRRNSLRTASIAVPPLSLPPEFRSQTRVPSHDSSRDSRRRAVLVSPPCSQVQQACPASREEQDRRELAVTHPTAQPEFWVSVDRIRGSTTCVSCIPPSEIGADRPYGRTCAVQN
jgi:hypothetical protein